MQNYDIFTIFTAALKFFGSRYKSRLTWDSTSFIIINSTCKYGDGINSTFFSNEDLKEILDFRGIQFNKKRSHFVFMLYF